MANRMTSARIVTPGQAMARIPMMTARMPSRINEVDDDLNMTGIPFRLPQAHHVLGEIRSACGAHQMRRPRGLANTCRLWRHSRQLIRTRLLAPRAVRNKNLFLTERAI